MTISQQDLPQALVVEFYIKPDFVARFESAVRQNAVTSLAQEPGCQYFDVCRDPAEPFLFFLYEVYADQEAVRTHLAASHYGEFDELTRDWVVKKTVRQMLPMG
jgi:quinol monooxygenase YgiN